MDSKQRTKKPNKIIVLDLTELFGDDEFHKRMDSLMDFIIQRQDRPTTWQTRRDSPS